MFAIGIAVKRFRVAGVIVTLGAYALASLNLLGVATRLAQPQERGTLPRNPAQRRFAIVGLAAIPADDLPSERMVGGLIIKRVEILTASFEQFLNTVKVRAGDDRLVMLADIVLVR